MILFFNLDHQHLILFSFYIQFGPNSFDNYFLIIFLIYFIFVISSLFLLFHLIIIQYLVLFLLIAIFFSFLDLFYFSISPLIISFHLIFISDLVFILLIIICFGFLILDFWMIENFASWFFSCLPFTGLSQSHDLSNNFWKLVQFDFGLFYVIFFKIGFIFIFILQH